MHERVQNAGNDMAYLLGGRGIFELFSLKVDYVHGPRQRLNRRAYNVLIEDVMNELFYEDTLMTYNIVDFDGTIPNIEV